MESLLLSIDASFSSTGYSIIVPKGIEVQYVSRICTTNDKYENDRMMYIIDELLNKSALYNVTDMVIEGGYGGVNVGTALMLSKLRGGILASFMREKYFTCEMFPTEIRKALGDKGSAKKEQVAEWILEMFRDNPIVQAIGPYSDRPGKKKTSDMYDAISIGVSYLLKVNNQ